jgi:tetratricopeptide (TPR) repeat protein
MSATTLEFSRTASASEFMRAAEEAFLQNDVAKALDCYEAALSSNPKSEGAMAGRALALLWLGRVDEAQLAALRAVAVVPTHPVALLVLARVAFARKDMKRARNFCEVVLSMDPADEEARQLADEIDRVVSPLGKFDQYISLGFNCEAGLQFQRIGWNQSSFFRFTLAPFEALCALLQNDFAGIYQRENLVPCDEDMVTDLGTGIGFHSRMRSVVDSATNRYRFEPNPDLVEIHRAEAEKASYLAEKWRQQARSAMRILYFLKLEGPKARERAIYLRDLILRFYPQHDFMLLVLQTEEQREPDWNVDRIVNRYLVRFCPPTDAFNGDTASWDRLFEEFPLRQEKFDKPGPMDCSSNFD